ncbi:hypothetical protein AN958_01128, partial [Leucoagaricus sp. SymC.cos]
RIFSAMLDELIFDVAIEAHHEVLKGKSICQICHTRCGSVHLPTQSNTTGIGGSQTTTGGPATGAGTNSRGDTPSSETGKAMGSGSVNGAGTPGGGNGGGNGSKDGTVLLDCVVCQRQIASNRYAPHLAQCMGLSSARRAPSARTSSNAGGKPKLPSDAGRSASPASEAGVSDDRPNGKGKGKAKSQLSEDTEGSLKRKRPQSPSTSPAKVKKAKASGSPVSRVKADPDATGPLTSHYPPSATGTKSKIPSKLRESSTTSFLERSPSIVVSSRSTSPAATPASSAFSAATQSPKISSRAINSHGPINGHIGANNVRGRSKVTGTGPPRRPVVSPPRPPPPPPPAIVHHSVVPDYGMHDGGDETGSSTDTDSD